MHNFLLELALLDCSGWLLGQEDGLPGCSDAGIDFLLLVILTVLLLLLLVLTLMLMLMLVLVTLLKWLRWVA